MSKILNKPRRKWNLHRWNEGATFGDEDRWRWERMVASKVVGGAQRRQRRLWCQRFERKTRALEEEEGSPRRFWMSRPVTPIGLARPPVTWWPLAGQFGRTTCSGATGHTECSSTTGSTWRHIMPVGPHSRDPVHYHSNRFGMTKRARIGNKVL
jgi:hypothetical protein